MGAELLMLDYINIAREAEPSSRLEDDHSIVVPISLSQYTMKRRPVVRSAFSEERQSSSLLDRSPVNGCAAASAQTPLNFLPMNGEQGYSGLEAVSYDELSASEAQTQRAEAPIERTIDAESSNNDESSSHLKTLRVSHKEWIPFMLRKKGAFLLALVLCVLVGLLESLDRLEQKRYR